uniref:Uncharacterized protein n=1 Tax=Anguilla anguilla TaxID=7936 RepID=A0A0E9VV70_ANGAN
MTEAGGRERWTAEGLFPTTLSG